MSETNLVRIINLNPSRNDSKKSERVVERICQLLFSCYRHVKIMDATSSSCSITNEVMQDSVFGPHTFTICINDMYECFSNNNICLLDNFLTRTCKLKPRS